MDRVHAIQCCCCDSSHDSQSLWLPFLLVLIGSFDVRLFATACDIATQILGSSKSPRPILTAFHGYLIPPFLVFFGLAVGGIWLSSRSNHENAPLVSPRGTEVNASAGS
jgi:hypothetical protein